MNILGIASDHAGFEIKEIIRKHLSDKGFVVKDLGAYSTESVDYPDFGHKLANAIENGDFKMGIAICGSGNGINMSLNKHEKIRSALCWSAEIAKLARSHNDANICTLPGRFVTPEQAKEIVDIFIATIFEGGRHQTRINKIPLNC